MRACVCVRPDCSGASGAVLAKGPSLRSLVDGSLVPVLVLRTPSLEDADGGLDQMSTTDFRPITSSVRRPWLPEIVFLTRPRPDLHCTHPRFPPGRPLPLPLSSAPVPMRPKNHHVQYPPPPAREIFLLLIS